MVWDAVQHHNKHWSAWPNPFPCQIKGLRRLSCTPEFVLDVQMTARCIANFLFTTFVPSPTEVTRKSLSGSYKCGFYLPIKARSPASIIWRDPAIDRVIIGITKPVTTALFAWWAAETLHSALDTWHTLHYIEDFCDQDLNSVMLANGHANLSTDSGGGALPFWNSLYDPNHWYDGVGADVVSTDSRFWTNDAYGYLASNSYTVDNFRIRTRVNPGGHLGPVFEIGSVPPFSTVKWHCHSDVIYEGGSTDLVMTWDSHGGTPLNRPLVVADRWIARGNPAIDTPDPWLNQCQRSLTPEP